MLVLGSEQILVACIPGSKTYDLKESDVEENAADMNNQTEKEHSRALAMIDKSDSLSVLVKAYMMEFSVGIHSVIIGLGIGFMSGEENVELLKVLIIAIVFHQFFEGVGLGTTLHEARYQLGKWQTALFVFLFSMMVSFGIIIGIVLVYYNGEVETTDELYATGILNALAAGILIYIALVEMVAEDFHSAAIANRGFLKFQMFVALMVGTMFLAVLAIWA